MPAAVPARSTIESAVDAWVTWSAGQNRSPGRTTIHGGANVAILSATAASSATIHGQDSVWTTSQTSVYDASDGRKKTNVPATAAMPTTISARRFQFTRRCSLKALVAVDARVRGDAVLQVVDCGQDCDRKREPGRDRPGDEGDPQSATRQPAPRRGQAREPGQDVDRHGADPDDEARLVQLHDLPARLVEREQREAGPEEEHGRHDDDRRDEHAQDDVRRTAPQVLVGAEVVTGHSPARGHQLQRDERDQQDADEGVHGEVPAHVEQGRALDRQQHEQRRGDGGGQPLVRRGPRIAGHRNGAGGPSAAPGQGWVRRVFGGGGPGPWLGGIRPRGRAAVEQLLWLFG